MTRRVVLITGCSRGIGQAAAIDLANAGWHVVGTLRGTEGQEVLEAAGVEIMRLDVCDTAAIKQCIQEITERHHRLDALVANAGYGLFGCFEDLGEAQVRQLMEVNFHGVLGCARYALPHLRQQQGRLVIMGSVAGRRGAPGSSIYNASKFALEGWAEGLSFELETQGVRVVLIEPGPTESGFAQSRERGERSGSGTYAELTRRIESLHQDVFGKADSVDVVTRAIRVALEADDPPLRLPTGKQTRLQILAHNTLPWKVWRSLIRRRLAFPSSIRERNPDSKS